MVKTNREIHDSKAGNATAPRSTVAISSSNDAIFHTVVVMGDFQEVEV